MKTILNILLFLCLSFHSYSNNIKEFDINFPNAEYINKYTVRIPITLVDHLMVIEATIHDKTGNFIIDTGSETLLLNKVHFPMKYVHNRKKNSSFGVLDRIDNPLEKKLKAFNLKHFSLKNKSSDVIDLSHIENSKKIRILGVIGFNILKDYEVFIDLHLNQITLSKTDNFGNKLHDKVYAEAIVDSLDFKLKNHTIILNGFVQETKVKFGLDSGAELNQINKGIGRKALKYFIPSKKLKLQGAGSKKIEVMAGNLHRVKLSNSVFLGPMKTILTNLNKMNEAFGTHLDGVLGFEFFKYKRTIINYKKEKLYFINYPNFGM